jgi:PAN domain
MIRWLGALIFCAMLACAAFPGTAHAQTGYDRPGGDYTNFVVRSGDPSVCALRCEREGHCRAWTFVYPTASGAAATCWLKGRVTARTENSCCVSGVRGAAVLEPKSGPVEFSIDRTGGDYRNAEISPDPTGNACAEVCKSDARCRAWTYLRPGYHGPSARCFFKDRLTAPRHRPCCISGVVR